MKTNAIIAAVLGIFCLAAASFAKEEGTNGALRVVVYLADG